MEAMSREHVDVLIVGAGLSGIGAGYHLQTKCPGKTFAILEARERDRRDVGPLPLPGHPLRLRHVHARLPVPAVGGREVDRRRRRRSCSYIARDRARARHRRARSASATASCAPSGRAHDARWTVDGRAHRHRRDGAAHVRLRLRRARGYYRYDQGYTPDFPGTRALRRARSCTRSTGPRTSTTRASASS